MKVIIIEKLELDKFPIWNATHDSQWMPLNNTVSEEYWLQLEAQNDLDKYGINYTIGEVEIKQEETEYY